MGIDIESFLEEDKPVKDKQECFFTMKKENEEVQLVDKGSITYQHFSEIADRFERGINGYSLSNDHIYFWNDYKIFYISFNEDDRESS